MSHGLSSTDVTRTSGDLPTTTAALPTDGEEQRRYADSLTDQVGPGAGPARQMSEKLGLSSRGREVEEAGEQQHFQAWDSFWGRSAGHCIEEGVNMSIFLLGIVLGVLEGHSIFSGC